MQHHEIRKLLAEKGNVVHHVSPEAPVAEAVRRMNDHHVGSLLVIDAGTLLGIFTERDVLVRVVDKGLDPRTTVVEEVMTDELITVSPNTTVHEAMHIVTRRRCRHLPVVEHGEVIGMISIGDLTRWMVRDQRDMIEHLERYITTG